MHHPRRHHVTHPSKNVIFTTFGKFLEKDADHHHIAIDS